MEEYAARLGAVGNMVIGALFLYLCSQLFHAPKDLTKVAKKPFHHVMIKVVISFLGAFALAAIMVIWTGV